MLGGCLGFLNHQQQSLNSIEKTKDHDTGHAVIRNKMSKNLTNVFAYDSKIQAAIAIYIYIISNYAVFSILFASHRTLWSITVRKQVPFVSPSSAA